MVLGHTSSEAKVTKVCRSMQASQVWLQTNAKGPSALEGIPSLSPGCVAVGRAGWAKSFSQGDARCTDR